MSKYFTLFMLLAFAWTGSLIAQEFDEPIDTPEREAAKLTVCNSPINFFDGQNVISILQEAKGWATGGNLNYGTVGDYYGGGPNQGDVDNFVDKANLWIDLLSNTDGLELTAMAGGESEYMTNRYGQDTGDLNDELPPAELLGNNKDLAIQNTVTLGRFYGRNNTSWEGEYSQLKFVAEQTEYVFYAAATQTPIVMDMDGDGKLEASNGQWIAHKLAVPKEKLVEFDINVDGFKELTEWTGPNDGLLCEYKDGDMTAANLFSNEGGKYKNGFEKLSLLDKNKDGKLDGEELSTLSVWVDKNGDAKVDDGEVSSVADLKITQISVEHKNLVASFIQDGTRKPMWDWNPATYMVKKTK